MESKDVKREAAVIVPVFRTPEGELRVLLVRRGPEGIHGGQIAFPGGMRDAADQSLLDTAVRELNEELGVPAADVKILGNLPVMETLTTGYTVSPFLAQMLKPGRRTPCQREIAEVFEIPVVYLATPESHDYGFESFATWPEPHRV